MAAALLASEGVPYAIEVPFLNRSIDLVFMEGDLITAVEFKRSDWRRGLLQARDHLLGADRVFVCLPANKINDGVLREADAFGLGVLSWSIDNPLEIRADAIVSVLSMQTTRRWLVDCFQYRRSESKLQLNSCEAE